MVNQRLAKSARNAALAGAVAIIGFGGSIAVAGGKPHNSYSDHATVTHVEPVYRTVRVNDPYQECWQEEVYHSGHKRNRRHGHTAGGTIVGGVIGGVIGHSIGKKINGGRGKNGGALLGTLVGAAIGHDHASNHGSHGHSHGHGGYTTVENRCKTVDNYHTEERLDGYRVSYEYNGQIFHTRMKYRPGNRIRVSIRVQPVVH